jgi:Tol biopolymer transport system component
VFLHDLGTGKTERVSVASDGSESNLGVVSNSASISSNGRFVAFESPAFNLVSSDTNAVRDVFIRDRREHRTSRVSVSPSGEQGNGESYCPSISGDGQHVTFSSTASNLVDDDPNTFLDVFVRDLRTKKNELVSKSSGGTHAIGAGGCPTDGRAISSNGRYVAFTSGSPNLVPNDKYFGGVDSDSYVYDRRTGRLELVSVTSYGEEPTGNGVFESFSADGRYVAFESDANDIFCCDTGSASLLVPVVGDYDVFVHDLLTGATDYISVAHDGKEASDCQSPQFTSYSISSSISATGRYVSFKSCAANLVANDTRDSSLMRDFDVFLRDRRPEMAVGLNLASSSASSLTLEGVPAFAREGFLRASDPSDDSLGRLADMDVIGGSIASRPRRGDLFAAIELEHLPSVRAGSAGTSTTGSPTALYGMRFVVAERRYEVRTSSLLGGTFGLFDCSDETRVSCSEVAKLRGGFGTTGDRVVFGIPVDALGLPEGGRLSKVEMFASVGTYTTGPTKVLDRMKFDR